MPEIHVDAQRVTYAEYGVGHPIVFLHAGAGSGKQWSKIGALLESRYRIIAPDLWGFGATERWTGSEALTHDHQAQLVEGVIRHCCREPVHLVGHSYGGATAVRLIAKSETLVKTGVLIEPIIMPLLKSVGEETLFREYTAMAHAFLSHAAAGELNNAWKLFFDYRNGPGTWNSLPEASKERFRAATQSTIVGFHSNLNNPTSINELEGFSLPMLVMCGDKTTVPDRRVTEIVRDHLPNCDYLLISGAEHMSPMSHPAFIAEAIDSHIRKSGTQ